MTGMDPKIMAAVFASIAAIAVGTGGTGTLQDFQKMSPGEIIGQFSNSPSDIISDLREKPVPENPVKITATISGEESISGTGKSLVLNDFTELVSEDRNISSDSEILFRDFSGRVELESNNLTGIEGSSSGFSSSGVSLSQSIQISAVTDAEEIRFSNISRQSVNLNSVDVRIKSRKDSTVIEKEDTSVDVNSFTGTVSYFRENSSLILEGDVDKVEAGGTTFSG